MNKLIEKYIKRLGFVSMEKYLYDMNKVEENLSSWRNLDVAKRIEDLENTVSDYDVVIQDCFENNHKLKKMEKYLNIKYVVTDHDLFVGYKKQK